MRISRRHFNRRFSRYGTAAAIALGLGLSSSSALAQSDYPSKPVRILVPFAAGGTTDIIARAIAEPLGKQLGQAVVVENKGGGGGTIGASEAARAPADGYLLSIATVSTTASNPAINPKVAYNPLTDFTPIINIAATPNIIAVHPSFPAKSYEEFVKAVQAKPDGYAYASSGTGGIAHLQMELFKTLTGLSMQHIPYRGSGPALADVVAGQVPILFDNLPSSLPFITSERLRPLAIAAPERIAALPQVPTFKELGLEPANRMAYYGIVGPKGLPAPIVQKIHAATAQVLQDPTVRKRIEDTGAQIVANSPEEFAAQIKAEYQVYVDVVKKQKLTLE
ncbi:ABC transporter substrate-binding protein [Vandammella animalimorsus]|uniref:ABC transporter substrate-binding protein n=1 Tax=Vandammella animalimorsus TaxID=2029117 RepID=A0A2A2AMQ9_9BURK|nr:tripartite tricarboxylate transporter substrate binding protein BugE [Vandammella animalimorsus]PAT39057.1 ABC transporter substrate-binding protein [Vandammella animalimorsus]